MIELGPIVMGCRRCKAKPGDPCLNLNVRRGLGRGEMRFHSLREADAKEASRLLDHGGDP